MKKSVTSLFLVITFLAGLVGFCSCGAEINEETTVENTTKSEKSLTTLSQNEDNNTTEEETTEESIEEPESTTIHIYETTVCETAWDPQNNLGISNEAFDNLMKVIYDTDDFSSTDADLLTSSMKNLMGYFPLYKDLKGLDWEEYNEKYTQSSDPRGLWSFDCYKIPAGEADKALKEIYGVTPDHSVEVKYNNQSNTFIYYEDGYYYIDRDTYGQEHIAVITDYTVSKGIYTIDVNWILPVSYDNEDTYELSYTTKLVVKPIKYNGQPWWYIYSCETVKTYY